jgi:glycerol-3-phosphate dehydrogenase
VRPLYGNGDGDASAVTRDYVLELDQKDDEAALLNIYGGKITTFRKLAESALAKLSPVLGVADRPWTSGTTLPGGDLPNADFDRFLATAGQKYPWLPKDILYRYARNYGTLINHIIKDATDLSGLGAHLGDGVYERELEYLASEEWARTAQDVLWRRSKLGLHVDDATCKAIEDWFDKNNPSKPTVRTDEGINTK